LFQRGLCIHIPVEKLNPGLIPLKSPLKRGTSDPAPSFLGLWSTHKSSRPPKSPILGNFEPLETPTAYGSEVPQNGEVGGEMQNFEVEYNLCVHGS
jgi:hypothetical protein